MHGVDGAYENTEGVEHIITVGDKRILIVHGHTVHVKSGLDFIINYACKKEVDACFFGHTHEAVAFTEQGIFFMNPGSLTCPRSGEKASYGLVSITESGEISGEVIKI